MIKARAITPEMRISELIELYPPAVQVLHRVMLDACCTGPHTLAYIADRHQIDIVRLVDALTEAAGGER